VPPKIALWSGELGANKMFGQKKLPFDPKTFFLARHVLAKQKLANIVFNFCLAFFLDQIYFGFKKRAKTLFGHLILQLVV